MKLEGRGDGEEKEERPEEAQRLPVEADENRLGPSAAHRRDS
jgi:hypothetical protein